MSRGPGTVQRLILDSIATASTGAVLVTDDRHTRAEAASLRRAAHRLAALGYVNLELRPVDGRRLRLVACVAPGPSRANRGEHPSSRA